MVLNVKEGSMFYIATRKQIREVSDILDDLDMEIWKIENNQSKKSLEKIAKHRKKIEKTVNRGFGFISDKIK